MKRAPAALVLIVLVASLAFSSPAPAQSFAVEKYKLPNGMTVILYPDHTLPVATINIWYRVGSKDDAGPPQRLRAPLRAPHVHGHRARAERRVRPDHGGRGRLQQRFDELGPARTTYSSGPASLLPTLLWLDAERLEDLPRAMDQKKVDLQRDVVRTSGARATRTSPTAARTSRSSRCSIPRRTRTTSPRSARHEDLKAAVRVGREGLLRHVLRAEQREPRRRGRLRPGGDQAARREAVRDPPARRRAAARRPSRPPGSTASGAARCTTRCSSRSSPSRTTRRPRYDPGRRRDCDLLASVLSDGKSSRLYKRLVDRRQARGVRLGVQRERDPRLGVPDRRPGARRRGPRKDREGRRRGDRAPPRGRRQAERARPAEGDHRAREALGSPAPRDARGPPELLRGRVGRAQRLQARPRPLSQRDARVRPRDREASPHGGRTRRLPRPPRAAEARALGAGRAARRRPGRRLPPDASRALQARERDSRRALADDRTCRSPASPPFSGPTEPSTPARRAQALRP